MDKASTKDRTVLFDTFARTATVPSDVCLTGNTHDKGNALLLFNNTSLHASEIGVMTVKNESKSSIVNNTFGGARVDESYKSSYTTDDEENGKVTFISDLFPGVLNAKKYK